MERDFHFSVTMVTMLMEMAAVQTAGYNLNLLVMVVVPIAKIAVLSINHKKST
jgi:hypothetical protein